MIYGKFIEGVSGNAGFIEHGPHCDIGNGVIKAIDSDDASTYRQANGIYPVDESGSSGACASGYVWKRNGYAYDNNANPTKIVVSYVPVSIEDADAQTTARTLQGVDVTNLKDKEKTVILQKVISLLAKSCLSVMTIFSLVFASYGATTVRGVTTEYRGELTDTNDVVIASNQTTDDIVLNTIAQWDIANPTYAGLRMQQRFNNQALVTQLLNSRITAFQMPWNNTKLCTMIPIQTQTFPSIQVEWIAFVDGFHYKWQRSFTTVNWVWVRTDYVPNTRTVAGKELSSDVTLSSLSINGQSYNGSSAITVTTPQYSDITNTVNAVKSEFYDEQLQVNWTMRMVNGEMKLYATTNVNMSVLN